MNADRALSRDPVGRAVGIVGLLAIALLHLLDAIGKFSETRYIFWLYVLLMAGTFAVSFVLLRTDSRLAWGLTALMAGLTLVAFVLSRTTGLPGAMDDIGNWSEGLGVASMFVEGTVLALSIYELVTTPAVHAGETQHVIDAVRGHAGADPGDEINRSA